MTKHVTHLKPLIQGNNQTTTQAQIPPQNQPPKNTTFNNSKFQGLKTFPRPLISPALSKKISRHDESNFETPPSRIYEVDSHRFHENASEKFVRAAAFKLPAKEAWINKFNFDFALTLSPLYEDPAPEDNEEEADDETDKETPTLQTATPDVIPYLDKQGEKIFRCERCGGFVNPFFEFSHGNAKYICNLCGMNNAVPGFYAEYLARLSAEDMPAYETESAVCDFLVDDSYKMAKFEKQNVLLAFEFSVRAMTNGSFFHALSSLESTLESLGDDINVALCLVDAGVTFFKVDLDEEEVGKHYYIGYLDL